MKLRIALVLLAPVLVWAGSPAHACAMITLRTAEQILMGTNEDWTEPGVIWFVPARKDRLGRVNVGFKDDFAQGSMNEKGLAFDAAVTPEVPWEANPDLSTPKNLLEEIMNTAGTVAEAVEMFETHNCPHLKRSQFQFADATGDSAVISWLPGRGLTVTRIEGDRQIATNTHLEPSGYRCARHVAAERVLASRSDRSLDAMAAALDAIHQHGPGAFTSYSVVYDLKARKLHLYNLADFDQAATFNLRAELGKGRKTRKMKKLFPGADGLDALRARPQRQEWGTRVELSVAELDRLEGVYSPAQASTVKITIVRQGSELRVENPGQPPATLFPESPTEFRIAPDRGRVAFDVDESGKVRGFTLQKQVDAYAKRVGDLSSP